jgi:hypothetical protein
LGRGIRCLSESLDRLGRVMRGLAMSSQFIACLALELGRRLFEGVGLGAEGGLLLSEGDLLRRRGGGGRAPGLLLLLLGELTGLARELAGLGTAPATSCCWRCHCAGSNAAAKRGSLTSPGGGGLAGVGA